MGNMARHIGRDLRDTGAGAAIGSNEGSSARSCCHRWEQGPSGQAW